MIAITFALPTESSDLRKKWLREAEVSKTADTKIIRGKISTVDVAVVHTGVGRRACEYHLENFFRTLQPKILISSGLAGALGPDPLVPETDFTIKDGHVSVPKGPGLGIAVDEKAVERYTLQRHVVK